jgi:hypothetical protein
MHRRLHYSVAQALDSTRCALCLEENANGGGRDPNRVADAYVFELSPRAQAVHGRGAEAEELGDLAHRKQSARTSRRKLL